MTRAESLSLAAAIIARSCPDLKSVVGLLENAGQRRLAAAIRRQAWSPTIHIEGQIHADPAMWLEGRVR